MNKRIVTVGAAALLTFGLAACGDDSEGEQSQEEQEQGEQEQGEQEQASPEQAHPEMDFSELPDTIAEVNGTDISRDLFEEQYTMIAMMSGMGESEDGLDPEITEMIVDGLVGQELLEQEAREQGYEPSEEEIDEYIIEQEQLDVEGMDVEEYYDMVGEQQGVNADEFREMLAPQVAVELYVNSQTDFEVTDEEVEEAYEEEVRMIEEMNAQFEESDEEVTEEEEMMGMGPQEVPEFSEVEEDLRTMLEQDKQTEYVFETLVPELEEQGDVTIHI
ncbi:SurA N-terminal domain-containing protein [Geomicrobium sp. JCM 19039]|uniref:SurA N-terminal domain-containing protein n=1 Tax=Geomicrobium sp. JCM 19039 TaxID=1460636 RepID=UPI00045F3B98|nr:SurA N-terminal domain-containing protein [Geomicrobium sp. JCM 19039]GAK11029.1 hypothetical protein JCM19039_699 [Geomicrobium sp. JCM 19039]